MGPLQVLAGGYRVGCLGGMQCMSCFATNQRLSVIITVPSTKFKTKSLSASGPVIKIYFGFCLLYAVFPPRTEN